MNHSGGSLAILRLVTTVGETSSPYNQFSLALSGQHNVALCSYFHPTVAPSPAVTVFEGDGSLAGYFRAMRNAFAVKDYDIIHGHMAATAVLFLLANVLLRKSLRSTVFTVHNCYQNHKFKNRLLLIPIFASYRRIVCCSKASLESFPAFYKWLGGKRLVAIENGVDMERIDRILGERKQRIDNRDRFTVISVGRLIKIKNPLTLINAFRQSALPESRLIFLGEGDLRGKMEDTIRASGLEVELAGLMPRNTVFEALAQADVFVSTSFGEGLPIAVLEAMACGCPVILSDIQPHREIAAGTDFIPLIAPHDSAGFAREISRFQSLSAAERSAVGEKCRAWVEERFSLTAMHKRYFALYEQVLE
ncbi:MAG: glycosyltransferase family 4 protein [Gammaproteobacteria bacterium]